MDCKGARVLIKRFLEIFVRGTPREVKLTSEELSRDLMRYAAAFYHIRECKEEKCSQLWQELNRAIKSIEDAELLVGKDGLLPFSY